MDPISQGVLGAALPQAAARKGPVALAGLFGLVAGLAPDLDVLIRSSEDPLLFLQYHRQFTHSFVFIPVGGFITALLVHWLFGRRWELPFRQSFLFCTLGYATHGLLDFATSYGTMLLWPFTDARFSASIISIIDPLFTVPILLLVITAAITRKAVLSRIAIAWAGAYLALATIQHFNAEHMAKEIAEARGHVVKHVSAKPSFGNILVWKTVYETEDRYYVDAVRAGIVPVVYPGTSVEKLDVGRDFPWVAPNSQQYNDIERFSWFSQGFVAKNPAAPNTVMDVRYSLLPNEINPLWWIELTPNAASSDHVKFVADRSQARENAKTLWAMITTNPDTATTVQDLCRQAKATC